MLLFWFLSTACRRICNRLFNKICIINWEYIIKAFTAIAMRGYLTSLQHQISQTKPNINKLDTPCAAGARSTSSIRGHPTELTWPIRHSRIGYLTSILTPGTADHEHDTFLLNFSKKRPKTSPLKRPPMCSWYFVSSFGDDHFLDP